MCDYNTAWNEYVMLASGKLDGRHATINIHTNIGAAPLQENNYGQSKSHEATLRA